VRVLSLLFDFAMAGTEVILALLWLEAEAGFNFVGVFGWDGAFGARIGVIVFTDGSDWMGLSAAVDGGLRSAVETNDGGDWRGFCRSRETFWRT